MDAPDLVHGDAPPEKLLRKEAVAQLLDCDPTTLVRMAKKGLFVQPLMIGKLLRWREADVNAWIAEAARKSQNG